MNRAQVQPLADALLSWLRPVCVRAEIAGSFRRGKEDVKDLEIVCEARIEECPVAGLFGDERRVVNHLEDEIRRATDAGWIEFDRLVKRNGSRYKRLRSRKPDIAIDLFIASSDPVENWGSVFAIRTGHAQYSAALMWALNQHDFRQIGGHVYDLRRRCWGAVPTEEAYFQLCGVPWAEPRERTPEAAARLYNELREGRAYQP